jgi:hypothetical protein
MYLIWNSNCTQTRLKAGSLLIYEQTKNLKLCVANVDILFTHVSIELDLIVV